MDRQLKRILYVEDEPDIQAIALMALETLGGFEVAVCDSGAQALACAPEFTPQLLLLDMMLPGLDGAQTAAQIRALPGLESVPVILMTAKVQQQELAAYRALGILGVISKPFDPMTLAEQIKAFWQQQ